ncbi:MAG TPA: DUF5995 family protein, partial [Bryobacteraceae bacterium]
MFPYDDQLAAATRTLPQTVDGVIQTMQTIDNTCADDDGLKWFNWIYLQVTRAVDDRLAAAGGFSNPAWLADLDVRFAALYFDALHAALTGAPCPGCWRALFSARKESELARIQFAMAGMNAHINHDLPSAIVATGKANNTAPQHGTSQYRDYTSLNTTLDSLINMAKQALNVRLPGDPLPCVSQLEDTIAAWNLAAAREKAWNNAQSLWSQPGILAAG